MIRRILSALACLFIFQIVTGQNNDKLKDNFDEGIYFFNRGEYEDAAYDFLQLVKAQPQNANFNFKVGECYLNIPGKEQLAIPYFKVAVQHNLVAKKKYSKKDFNEKNAPLYALFYLGKAYRADNQLNNALESYKKFMNSPLYYGDYNENVVENEVKSCERAKIIQDDPLDYEKINLGPAINTQDVEEKPVISGDGNSLAFIRRLKFYDAIFYSVKKDSVWQVAINIDPQILSDGDFYPTGFSFNGKKLLLVKKTRESSDIYMSELDSGIWSKAEKLKGKINSPALQTYASFGQDEHTIYLSSNRRGSKGGFDIFTSKQEPDGSWSKPKNLGKIINTQFDEQAPYLCPDGKTLLFSSTGHYNMGGYDIFYSTMKGKKWSLPINLGYPINNTRDNLNYCPLDNGREGYYSISDSLGYGMGDIYLIRIKSQSVLNFDKTKKSNK